MKRNVCYDLFLMGLLLKASELGIGKDITWLEVFVPLLLLFLGQIAEGLGYKDQLQIWVLERIYKFKFAKIVRDEKRKLKKAE